LTSLLGQIGVGYHLNPKLVRGLDYYCHTTFEFTTEALGAQGAVLAGGRYDGLVEQMGGPATPGTGWAAGVERLMMLIDAAPPALRPVAVVPHGSAQIGFGLAISQRLRHAGFSVEFGYKGNLGKRLKRANKVNARAAVILGEDELSRDAVTVRDMDTGEQNEVLLASLEDHLGLHR